MSLAQFLELQQAMAARSAEQVSTTPVALIDERLGPCRLGPDDVFTVTLTSPQATILPFPARIDGEGFIDLPVAGRVKVAGLSPADAERLIKDAYVPEVYGDVAVNIQLAGAETTGVFVHGAVTLPGLIQLRHCERDLLHAVSAAGGATIDSSIEATLSRARRPAEVVTFDLTDPVQLQDALALAPLEDGDIIEVRPREPNTVFVGGLVLRPAPQVYPHGASVNVLQALASAQGLRTDVTPEEATLIRRMADGTDAMVKLNLDAIARGEAPNMMLEPGDILWVPPTAKTRVQDFINRNFFMRAGVSVTYNVTGIEFLNRHSQQSQGLGSGGGGLQDSFDPLGFLNRNAALQTIVNRPLP